MHCSRAHYARSDALANVGLMRSTLLRSLEALLALKARGKVVAGGFPSGRKQSLMLIMEAESEEEEVVETLQSLPCWNEVVNPPEVTRLHILEELSGE